MAQVANIVLPSASTDNPIGEQLLAIQQRQEALQRKQQQDNEDMVKYMTQQLDFNKFATGTAADSVINDWLNGMFMKYADRIKQNKGESMSNILFDMQQDVNKLKGYTTKVKAIRDRVKTETDTFAKDNPDVDASVLERNSLTAALFKRDPATGQPVLKDPDEMDLNQSYVQNQIRNKEDEVFKQDYSVFSNLANKTPGVKLKGNVGDDVKGVKTKRAWEAELKPFEEFVTDKEGQYTGVRIKFDVKKDANGMPVKGKDGKEIRMLPKDVYDNFIGNTGNEYRVRAELKRQANRAGKYIDPNTPEGEEAKRIIAYDLLNAFRPQGTFSFIDDKNQDAWVGKQQAGVTNITNNYGDKDKTNGTDYVDAYNEINERTSAAAAKGMSAPANELSTKAFEAVIKIAKERTGINDLSAADIKLWKDSKGDIYIYPAYDIIRGKTNDNPGGTIEWKNRVPIAKLDKVGTDLKVNTRAKEQQQIIKEGNPKGGKTYKGLDKNGNPIFE